PSASRTNTPALSRRMSIDSSRSRPASAATACPSVTSTPSSTRAPVASSSGLELRQTAITRSPRPTYWRTSARPIPRLAPVIRTVFMVSAVLPRFVIGHVTAHIIHGSDAAATPALDLLARFGPLLRWRADYPALVRVLHAGVGAVVVGRHIRAARGQPRLRVAGDRRRRRHGRAPARMDLHARRRRVTGP